MSQDTYRGEGTSPNSLNLYSYCEGNPTTYTDPSGHWVSAVIFGALGAYDGYKYAKKKGLKGWKMAAAVAGGAALGAVDPFKVFKAAKTGYKAYKVVKLAKVAKTAAKSKKVAKVLKLKPKKIKAAAKVAKKALKPKKAKVAKKAAKKVVKKTSSGACFTKGTKVHTNGGFKAIDKIRVGDHVWSENPETNEKALKKVKKIFVREKDSIIRLSINGEVIKTTDEHPFYKEGVGFVPAASLEVGDQVRTEDGISDVEEAEEIHLAKPIKVYNIEVEDYHTYYVSEAKVLVHNTCAATVKNTAQTATSKTAKVSVVRNTTKLASKPYAKSRPSFRKGVVEKVWELAKKDGVVRDYHTQEIIQWTPGTSRKGEWDMGHIPTEKYSRLHREYMEGRMSKKEFLDWYNDPRNYRVELPKNNRSHRFE